MRALFLLALLPGLALAQVSPPPAVNANGVSSVVLVSPGVRAASGVLAVGASGNSEVDSGAAGIPTKVYSYRATGQSMINFAGASYTTAAGQSLTINQWTRVNFATAVFDTDGAGGTSVTTGASWVYTAPTTAVYQVSAAVSLTTSSAGSEGAIAIYVNGASVRRGNDIIWSGLGAGAIYPSGLVVSALLLLTAADTVDIRAYTTTGSQALTADATRNYVSIHRVPGS